MAYSNPWAANNTIWFGEEKDKWDPDNDSILQTNGLRTVTIVLTSKVVGTYEARSYPHHDIDGNGLIELYEVPVHEILIKGTDSTGNPVTYVHMAPRFMPFYNDPNNPDSHYSGRGWINAGLYSARRIVVSKYIEDYQVQNRLTPGKGAIVMKGAFYIHGGPADLNDYGYGSAGCVEIVGSWDDFKSHIMVLSGSDSSNMDQAIKDLIKNKKLIIDVKKAKLPDIKQNFTREVSW